MRTMKDSGIEWIGEIPQSWNIKKFKHVVKSRDERYEGIYGDLKYIGLENVESFTAKYLVTDSQYDSSLARIAHETDILFGKLRPYLAKVFLPDTTVCCSGEFAVFSAFGNRDFFKYLMLSTGFIDTINGSTYGTKMPRANVTFIENILIAVPPVQEQTRIADFLDEKCDKIDVLIALQEQEIEKLKEYKQSVITHAVTKGLDDSVPMKDSGDIWYGVIAEGNEIIPTRRFYSSILGKMVNDAAGSSSDTLEKYLCAANVHFTGVDLSIEKHMWFSPAEKVKYEVKKGDLLVVEGGAGAGGASVLEVDLPDWFGVQNSIQIVRSTGQGANKFLYYVLFFLINRGYIDFVCHKATIPHFTKEKLLLMPMVNFSREEQTAIVEFLDQMCSKVDALITAKRSKIETLKEYKKSLIYEYITGKREVI